MIRWHEAQLARREERLHIAFDVEEVDAALLAAPLQAINRPICQAGNAHGLRDAGHAEFTIEHACIAREHAPDLEQAHARRAARQVVAQGGHEAADEARAHHRERRGNRIDDADGIGIASQLALPAFFDEAE